MTSAVNPNTSGMLRQRHTESELKHQAVKTAVLRRVRSGVPRSVAGTSRNAHTTETFLYRHENHPCALCEGLFGGGPVSYYRAQMSVLNSTRERSAETDGRVTAAALRADLANSKAANERLRQQLRTLERRLGQVIGTHADNSTSELQTLVASAQPSQADLASLSATIDKLQSVIGERDQDLEAARRLNADLTRQLNQSVSIRNPSNPRSS
jgi:uncharacterized coiled-coil protein SlyX